MCVGENTDLSLLQQATGERENCEQSNSWFDRLKFEPNGRFKYTWEAPTLKCLTHNMVVFVNFKETPINLHQFTCSHFILFLNDNYNILVVLCLSRCIYDL